MKKVLSTFLVMIMILTSTMVVNAEERVTEDAIIECNTIAPGVGIGAAVYDIVPQRVN